MTENKPIIIDGVDVSKCKHFKNRTCLADYLLTDMDFSEAKCEICKDCYFKQFTRKTQECEQKEQELLNNEKIINKLIKELDQLKAEKAKLETQIEADTQYHVKEECNLRKIIRNKEKRNVELYKENNQLKAAKEQAEQKNLRK